MKIVDREYQYNCVNPMDLDELLYICDNMSQITYRTFLNNVNKSSLKCLSEELGYGDGLELKEDWHVSYHKCKLKDKNKTAYILCHSCIEHVFY